MELKRTSLSQSVQESLDLHRSEPKRKGKLNNNSNRNIWLEQDSLNGCSNFGVRRSDETRTRFQVRSKRTPGLQKSAGGAFMEKGWVESSLSTDHREEQLTSQGMQLAPVCYHTLATLGQILNIFGAAQSIKTKVRYLPNLSNGYRLQFIPADYFYPVK